MNLNRSNLFRHLAVGAVCISALLAAASASAQVNWSIGINAPGPVYYEPAPVFSRPAPIYYQPSPPVYYRQAPQAYYSPPPVYYGPSAQYQYERGDHWRREHEHEHEDHDHHHHREWDDRD